MLPKDIPMCKILRQPLFCNTWVTEEHFPHVNTTESFLLSRLAKRFGKGCQNLQAELNLKFSFSLELEEICFFHPKLHLFAFCSAKKLYFLGFEAANDYNTWLDQNPYSNQGI